MIAIVDYGMGNLLSVYHALETVGAEAVIVQDPAELRCANRVVLPGVGAFRDCMANLRKRGFCEALRECVLQRGAPFLGICLGLQALARGSSEGGSHGGLCWLEADVARLQPEGPGFRVPHVGWNDVQFREGSPLFSGLKQGTDLYFVHSYGMRCACEEDVDATFEYGGRMTAAIRKGNVFAAQFHPEKSQDNGLRILENFLKWEV